ncbi:MAG: hypothetical protein PHS75_10855 [Anaerolineaceae bacterium]|jgi:hypothetical protein|nr:hypothetical protein [Anaerolineaceae bacterium]
MKNKFIVISLLVSLSSNLFAQSCDIVNAYSEFIVVTKTTYNAKSSIKTSCFKINEEICYAPFVNAPISFNYQYVEVLLDAFSTVDKKDLAQWDDTVAIKKEYFSRLQKDSVFTPLLKEWMAKSIDKTLAKDSILMKTLLNIAVKYFMVLKITNEGSYVGKVCLGINLINATEKVRNPFVETFCFATIMNHYSVNNEYNTQNMLIEGIMKLYTLNLGINKEEQLLRAQGAMFMFMTMNEKLRKLLIKEYEQNKESLPFILKY